VDVGPVDAEVLLLGLDLPLPQFAVGICDLLEVEMHAGEPPAVVERHGVVDARAEEHRPGGRLSFAADESPTPCFAAHQPQGVGRV